MRVLFIYSANNCENGLNILVKNQGKSLSDAGIEIDYYPIVGKGLKGYLKNVFSLRKYIKNNYDIFHAHYCLTAFVATLSGCKPLVVSLMGSDVRMGFAVKFLIKVCSLFFWDKVIVKSNDSKNNIKLLKKSMLISNGVDTALFKPISKRKVIDKIRWEKDKKHILFASSPSRPVKNFSLLAKAYDLINKEKQIVLHMLKNVYHSEVPKYMNASDVVVLTSLWEGSPNVIKEAMACNRPIVSTDVGDVKEVLGLTKGCFITSYDSVDLADNLKRAIDFSQKYKETEGRARIINLGLDKDGTAKKIIRLYETIIGQNTK
jgi:glycosyltransferase involved in cell wall biosynthesis